MIYPVQVDFQFSVLWEVSTQHGDQSRDRQEANDAVGGT